MEVINHHYDTEGNIVLIVDDMTENGRPTTIKIIPRRNYVQNYGQVVNDDSLNFAGQLAKKITKYLNNLNELSFWDGPDNSPV